MRKLSAPQVLLADPSFGASSLVPCRAVLTLAAEADRAKYVKNSLSNKPYSPTRCPATPRSTTSNRFRLTEEPCGCRATKVLEGIPTWEGFIMHTTSETPNDRRPSRDSGLSEKASGNGMRAKWLRRSMPTTDSSVKERVMQGKQRTADAERLQRHSGRVAE